MSGRSSVERERSSAENVTIIAETFSENTGATVSSIKSEDSTEQLICKTPQQKSAKRKVDTHAATLDRLYDKEAPHAHAPAKSAEASVASDASARDEERQDESKVILLLGLGQLGVGVAMVVFGALVIVHNSSLSRVGAGLWAGCIAVATGVVGVLAGINDCYGLYGARRGRSGAFLTAFLALSLASLAAGNMAAVLAAAGVYRDTHNNRLPAAETEADFEDEQEAWTPVLTNIGLIIISSLHCLLAVISIYHASRRVCPCFQTKEPYNHNQFDPSYTSIQAPYVIHVSEKTKPLSQKTRDERIKNHELCKDLERKLNSDLEASEKRKEMSKKGKVEELKDGHFDSANSKEKLVTSWLGRHHAQGAKAAKGKGVRKMKMKGQPIVLLPAHPSLPSHPASTLGRSVGGAVPLGVVAVAGRYHTLPLPPPPQPHPLPPPHYRPHQLYYPVHEVRGRRRRSPRAAAARGCAPGAGAGGGGGGAERRARGRGGGARNSQLTRSLERIHRKSRDKQLSEVELRRTYTGLDRTIAEQFIAVCDETRNQPPGAADSSGFDTASSECHSNRF